MSGQQQNLGPNMNAAPPLPVRRAGAELQASLAAETGNFIADSSERQMDGWYSDLTITGDRLPTMNTAEVQEKWAFPYGQHMGKILLPGRWKPHVPKDEREADEHLRSLHMFDARKSKDDPPKFIVAAETTLDEIATKHPRLRALYARLHPDVKVIREGRRLHVGDGKGRWLPSALKKVEDALKIGPRMHENRKVISRDQARFYVGGDGELHARSEGRNAAEFEGIPNAAERRQQQKERGRDQRLEDQMVREKKLREQFIGSTATSIQRPVPQQPTEYLARHRLLEKV